MQARIVQVDYASTKGLSSRRACALLGISRTMLYYDCKKPVADELILERLREILEEHVDYGYRRAHQEYIRRFENVNRKKIERIWRSGGLSLPKKRRRKRRHGEPQTMTDVTRPNQVWALDFMEDTCMNGSKLRILTILDEYSRECLSVFVSRSIKSKDVVTELNKLLISRGIPEYLRSDNGPEFVSNTLKGWLSSKKIDISFIEPGKPWQNGKNERFNGTLRKECLNKEVFINTSEAAVVINEYCDYYNTKRLHSSLGNLTPLEFFKKVTSASQCDYTEESDLT